MKILLAKAETVLALIYLTLLGSTEGKTCPPTCTPPIAVDGCNAYLKSSTCKIELGREVSLPESSCGCLWQSYIQSIEPIIRVIFTEQGTQCYTWAAAECSTLEHASGASIAVPLQDVFRRLERLEEAGAKVLKNELSKNRRRSGVHAFNWTTAAPRPTTSTKEPASKSSQTHDLLKDVLVRIGQLEDMEGQMFKKEVSIDDNKKHDFAPIHTRALNENQRVDSDSRNYGYGEASNRWSRSKINNEETGISADSPKEVGLDSAPAESSSDFITTHPLASYFVKKKKKKKRIIVPLSHPWQMLTQNRFEIDNKGDKDKNEQLYLHIGNIVQHSDAFKLLIFVIMVFLTIVIFFVLSCCGKRTETVCRAALPQGDLYTGPGEDYRLRKDLPQRHR